MNQKGQTETMSKQKEQRKTRSSRKGQTKATSKKVTQAQINEIFKASTAGLTKPYIDENCYYLVDKKGNPIPFHGFENDKNVGIEMPYIICNVHKPVTPPQFPFVQPDDDTNTQPTE